MPKVIDKIIASPITGLVLAVVVAIGAFLPSKARLWVMAIVGSMLFLYLVLKCVSFMRQRRFQRAVRFSLVYSKIEHDWQISENGDFLGCSVYRVRNTGGEPINVIPLEDGRWLTSPEIVKFNCTVVPPDGKFKIVDYQKNLYPDVLSIPGYDRTYVVSWSHKIAPALRKDEEMAFEIRIDTPQTEKQSFTIEGGYAGIPTALPTLEATLNFKAPNGYKFKLLDTLNVIDTYGNTNVQEVKRIDKPVLSLTKTVITWRLTNLIAKHRYYFGYRLLREKNDG